MKTLLFLFLFFLLGSYAYSQSGVIQCRDRAGKLDVELNRYFSGGNWDGRIFYRDGGSTVEYRNFFNFLNRFGYEIRFWGGSDRLTIDTWPDRNPRRFRSYRSTFRSRKIADGRDQNLNCEFFFF